jgi:hypothetical protein
VCKNDDMRNTFIVKMWAKYKKAIAPKAPNRLWVDGVEKTGSQNSHLCASFNGTHVKKKLFLIF